MGPSQVGGGPWKHCAAKINNTHFFIAGNDFYDGTSAPYILKEAFIVDAQDLSSLRFTPLPDMLHERSGAACGVVMPPADDDGNDVANDMAEKEVLLLVAGGSYSPTTSEMFDLKTYEWKNGPTIPDNGFSDGGYVSTMKHPLLLVGGKDKNDYLRNNIISYNRQEKTFEVLAGRLQTPRISLTAVAVETLENCGP